MIWPVVTAKSSGYGSRRLAVIEPSRTAAMNLFITATGKRADILP